MKYGIAIRNMGPQSTRDTIVACARAAEQLGFDAVFVSDHLALPPDDVEGSGGRYLDVLATLAFLAGATERIRLGVSVSCCRTVRQCLRPSRSPRFRNCRAAE